MQGDRRVRRPFLPVAAHQFGGQVLGLGGAAAVARREQSAAGRQDAGEQAAPLGDPAEAVAAEPAEGLFQGPAVQVRGVQYGGRGEFSHGDRVRRVTGTAA